MTVRVIGTVLAAGAIAFGTPASAAQKSATFQASLNVTTGCTMRVSGLDFGDVKVITPTVDAQSDIDVRCTAYTPFAVSIDAGSNAVGLVRNMRADKFPTRVQPYAIYRDAARTQLWNPGTSVAGNTGNVGMVRVSAYGRVAGMTQIFPSPYRDQVTVTLTF